MPTTTNETRQELARIERTLERYWRELAEQHAAAKTPAARQECERAADRIMGRLYEVGVKLAII